ncbi:hypothetical protein [Streptomyces turgidiscabies]|uniref:hypothetical protein n=1 Tax=Streptomyces turgidiscabies TaxID=85558 RepID=UPI0038F66272
MNARTAAVTVLLALAAFTAGCSSDSTTDKPAATATPAASPTPSIDQAAARQACVDAVAAIPADDNGEVPSEPVPDECKALTDGDYLDAYMDGIGQANQDGRDALQDLIDEASSEAAQP